MNDIEQRVKKVIAEQLSINEADIKNESAFIEDLGADSLDTVELVMALEDAFIFGYGRIGYGFGRRFQD